MGVLLPHPVHNKKWVLFVFSVIIPRSYSRCRVFSFYISYNGIMIKTMGISRATWLDFDWLLLFGRGVIRRKGVIKMADYAAGGSFYLPEAQVFCVSNPIRCRL
jgi:hypothetical protein